MGICSLTEAGAAGFEWGDINKFSGFRPDIEFIAGAKRKSTPK